MEVLVTLLLCALGTAIYFANKYKEEVARLKEKLREQEFSSYARNEQILPSTRKFVSVSFNEGDTQFYDYFIGNIEVKVGDCVEVPFHSKYTGKNEVKIATVKYVSTIGEQSNFARSNVIRKIYSSLQSAKNFTDEKRFVNVIFEKDAEKSYSYLVGDFEVTVGDFVVVHTSDKDTGNVRLRTAQIIYISSPGEVSDYAKTPIIKKAKKNKW